MINQQNLITPSPELVQQWIKEANHNEPMFAQVAVTAAQWGAQQERKLWLEAINSRKNGARQRSPIMQQLANH